MDSWNIFMTTLNQRETKRRMYMTLHKWAIKKYGEWLWEYALAVDVRVFTHIVNEYNNRFCLSERIITRGECI